MITIKCIYRGREKMKVKNADEFGKGKIIS